MRAFSTGLVLLACTSCNLIGHTQREGDYTFSMDRLILDECDLISEPKLLSGGSLDIDGDQVRLSYALFDIPMIGFYRSAIEEFTLDGSTANVDTALAPGECLLDLVTVHLDAKTVDANTFTGGLSVKLDAERNPACMCEAQIAYTAHRNN